jgi:penicillin V acylase-like amidase (Ntn superfamily)
MKKHLIGFILSIIVFCLVPAAVLPCTTFMLDNGTSVVVAKNFDSDSGPGLLIVNKRDVSKSSMHMPDEENLINWASKYGSVTFTYLSREMPFGGMNEAGLVIEAMMLPNSEFPQPDSRPPIYEVQWVQYQLDNFSTVDDIIASDKIIRIPQTQDPYRRYHYFAADSTGNCASIEWLNGKMTVHTAQTMPVTVLTNNAYDQSVKFLQLFQGFGGVLPARLASILIKCFRKTSNNSLPRFVCAADMVKKFDPERSGPVVDYAFNILSNVAQPTKTTQWSIVYDISNRTVYFRTIHNDKIRNFNLSSFDFSCTTPVKALDINADLSGDVTSSFVDYTEEMGRELLKNSTSEEAIDYFATYPEKYTYCTE